MNNLSLSHISACLSRPLLGWDAQKILAPSFREEEIMQSQKKMEDARKSAVLILLYKKNDTLHIPVILRNEYNGAHSGQISLPGGKVEKFDDSHEDTALRETYEEIGVERKKIKVIGCLSDLYIPPSHFLVKPFVGYIRETPKFKPDPKEVQRVIEIPLESFFKEDVVKEKAFVSSSSGVTKKAPYFDVENIEIWGATAMILSELIEIIR